MASISQRIQERGIPPESDVRLCIKDAPYVESRHSYGKVIQRGVSHAEDVFRPTTVPYMCSERASCVACIAASSENIETVRSGR